MSFVTVLMYFMVVGSNSLHVRSFIQFIAESRWTDIAIIKELTDFCLHIFYLVVLDLPSCGGVITFSHR